MGWLIAGIFMVAGTTLFLVACAITPRDDE